MLHKIILIHGLNNNLGAFAPFKDALTKLGFDCHLVCLPGHGEDRSESANFKLASTYFEKSLRPLINEPYGVIAFSQGGLYLQMWLKETSLPKPQAQVLLAPALFIRNFSRLKTLVNLLPPKTPILSPMPKPLKRFPFLFIKEYRTLFEGAEAFGKTPQLAPIPTLVIVDPKDEVVDAQKLKSVFKENVAFQERPYLKGRRPGKHHIIFHPDYFEKADWNEFLITIQHFFNAKA